VVSGYGPVRSRPARTIVLADRFRRPPSPESSFLSTSLAGEGPNPKEMAHKHSGWFYATPESHSCRWGRSICPPRCNSIRRLRFPRRPRRVGIIPEVRPQLSWSPRRIFRIFPVRGCFCRASLCPPIFFQISVLTCWTGPIADRICSRTADAWEPRLGSLNPSPFPCDHGVLRPDPAATPV